jgi:hypothetical protein
MYWKNRFSSGLKIMGLVGLQLYVFDRQAITSAIMDASGLVTLTEVSLRKRFLLSSKFTGWIG